MSLMGKNIGFVLTGSHCTIDNVLHQIKKIVDSGANVVPILSETVQSTNTRYGVSEKWVKELLEITNNQPVVSITEAEPIGPLGLFDVIIVAPCTGNTLAKLANGITDTTALMAIKAQLRNLRPVVLAVSTNDGLSINAKNIGSLINMKRIYLVPFGQDNFKAKANSIAANMDLIIPSTLAALEGVQYQPVLIQYW